MAAFNRLIELCKTLQLDSTLVLALKKVTPASVELSRTDTVVINELSTSEEVTDDEKDDVRKIATKIITKAALEQGYRPVYTTRKIRNEAFFLAHKDQYSFTVHKAMSPTDYKRIPVVIDYRLRQMSKTKLSLTGFTLKKSLASCARGLLSTLHKYREPAKYQLNIMNKKKLQMSTGSAEDLATAVNTIVGFMKQTKEITLDFSPTTDDVRSDGFERNLELMRQNQKDDVQKIARRKQISEDDATVFYRQEVSNEILQCHAPSDPRTPSDLMITYAVDEGLMQRTGDSDRDFLLAMSHLHSTTYIDLWSDTFLDQLDQSLTDALRRPVAGVMSSMSFSFPKGTHYKDWKHHLEQSIRPIVERVLTRSLGTPFRCQFSLNCTTMHQLTAEIGTRSFYFPNGVFRQVFTVKGVTELSTALENAMEAWMDMELNESNRVLHELKDFTVKVLKCPQMSHKGYKSGGKKPGVIQPYNSDNLCAFRCLAIAKYQKLYSDVKYGENKSPLQRLIAQDLCCRFYGCENKDDGRFVNPLILDVLALEEFTDVIKDSKKLHDIINKRAKERGQVCHTEQCQKQVVPFEYDSLRKLAQATNCNMYVCFQDSKSWEVICNAFTDEEAEDVFLDYSKVDEAEGHFSLIDKIHNYGGVTKCPYCGKKWKRKSSGRYEQSLKDYKGHLNTCQNRRTLNINPKYVKSCLKYSPIHKTYEELVGSQYQYETYIGFDIESILDSKQIHHAHTIVAMDRTYKHKFVYTNTSKVNPLVPTKNDVGAKFLNWLQYSIADKLLTNILDARTAKAAEYQHLCKCSEEDGCTKDCPYSQIQKELRREITVPILGYNSGRYDMIFLLSHIKQVKRVVNQASGILELRWRAYSRKHQRYITYVFMDMFKQGGGSLEDFARRNGVSKEKLPFNYDYIKDPSQFKEITFPTGIWGDQEAKALEIWNSLPEPSMKAYTERYCLQDVELLMDAIANYRETVFRDTQLEVLNYLTISQLGDNVLKSSFLKTTVHTIPSEKAAVFIKSNIYGGICIVLNHYSKATRLRKIFGLDANAMHPWAMSRPLLVFPTDDKGEAVCEFIEDPKRCGKYREKIIQFSKTDHAKDLLGKLMYDEVTGKVLHDLNDDGLMSSLVQCDLYCTDAQKERLKDLPVLPTRERPPTNFGPFGNRVKSTINKKPTAGEDMLLLTLDPKPDYVIPSYVLTYLLANDMVTLARVKKILPMRFEIIFKEFVDYYTEKRREAQAMIIQGELELNDALIRRGESLKAYYKLILNSVYGKTLQDETKYTREFIVSDATEFLKKAQGKQILDVKQLSATSLMVSCRSVKRLKTPRYLGMGILWMAKLLLFDFIYNCLWKTYSKEDLELLYIDTDGVYVNVKANSYEDFLSKFSDPLRNQFFANGEHDITPGKFKLESNLEELIALAPKLRSMKFADGTESRKAKGVMKADLKTTHDQFLQTYRELAQIAVDNVIFKKQFDKTNGGVTMQTQRDFKTLTMLDRKSYWLTPNKCVPHGYYKGCKHKCDNQPHCARHDIPFCAHCPLSGLQKDMIHNTINNIDYWSHQNCSQNPVCIICARRGDPQQFDRYHDLCVHKHGHCRKMFNEDYLQKTLLHLARKQQRTVICSHEQCDQICQGNVRAEQYSEDAQRTKMWRNWCTSIQARCSDHGIAHTLKEIEALAPKDQFTKKIQQLLENHSDFSEMNYGTKWNLEHRIPVSSLWEPNTVAAIHEVASVENIDVLSPKENSKRGGYQRKKDALLRISGFKKLHN